MARTGTAITLKYWLEASKTYHGPINLRFTWPIELTKTYHICRSDHVHILNLLGNKSHGQQYHDGYDLSIRLVRHGVQHYVYRIIIGRRHGSLEDQVRLVITDYQVLAPQLLDVRYLSILIGTIPIHLRITRTRTVRINKSNTGYDVNVYKHRILVSSTRVAYLKYEKLLKILQKYE